MATLRLNIEDEDDLELLGIQSNLAEHRLVWSLNKELGVLLERSKDYVLELDMNQNPQSLFNTEKEKEFSVFVFESDFERITLISNLAEGVALYDKGRSFDYLLRIVSAERSFRDLCDQISEMKGILAVSKIEVDSGDKAAKPFNLLE